MEERLKGVIDLIRDNPSISRTAMAAELELTEAQIKTAINIAFSITNYNYHSFFDG